MKDLTSPSPRPTPAEFSPGYLRYALALLVVVYVFNFIDRTILSILLQPIKEEFQISDVWLGFLSGPAFAILYTVVGLPIARWADRGASGVADLLMRFDRAVGVEK